MRPRITRLSRPITINGQTNRSLNLMVIKYPGKIRTYFSSYVMYHKKEVYTSLLSYLPALSKRCQSVAPVNDGIINALVKLVV